MSPSCRVRSGFVVFPRKWNESAGNPGHKSNDDILLVRERLSGLNAVEVQSGVGGMSDPRHVGMRIKDGDLKRVKFGAEPCAHYSVGLFFSLHHQESLSEFCFLEPKYLQISSVLRLWGNCRSQTVLKELIVLGQ